MSQITNETPSEDTSAPDLSKSEWYRLLTSERRRVLLEILDGQSDPLQLADVAATVASREAGVETPTDAQVDRVKISLHHVDLPKLDAYGIVNYDSDSQRIEISVESVTP